MKIPINYSHSYELPKRVFNHKLYFLDSQWTKKTEAMARAGKLHRMRKIKLLARVVPFKDGYQVWVK